MSRVCCCAVGERTLLFGGDKTHNSLYILDLRPSLKTLCKRAVIQYELEHSGLPHNIRWELAAITNQQQQQKKMTVRKKEKEQTIVAARAAIVGDGQLEAELEKEEIEKAGKLGALGLSHPIGKPLRKTPTNSATKCNPI